MAENKKPLVKRPSALTQFDPKAPRELVVRGLNALTVIDANFYFSKAEEHKIRGELQQAISYYEKALQIDPEHEDSLFWMGYCYSPKVKKRTGDDLELADAIRNERAASAFQKLIDVRKKKDSIEWSSYVVYYNIGVAQYNLGLYEASIESYEHSIKLNPEHANSYYMLGLSQEKLGIYHLALENFETYLNLDDYEMPKTPECVEYAKKRIEELKGLLTYTYFYNTGIEFRKKGQYLEAIKCYEQAIELNPEDANSYYNLGLPQYDLGLYEVAIESFERAIKLNPELANSYYMLGLSQEKLNLYNSALDNFEIYLRLVNHESPENQQFITYANNRMKELTVVRSKTIKVAKAEPLKLGMVLIPAGEFEMGDHFNEGYDDERPVHTVYTDAFYIDKYEVTNAQYAEFLNAYGKNVDAAGHQLLDIDDSGCLIEKTGNIYKPKAGYENHPVVEVSWYGAAAYAQFYGERLPTEAEWEKAARGGLVGKRYPWGDDISHDDANYLATGGRDKWRGTSPVGSFPPNGYGLYDMAGNVWEWCADEYELSYDDGYYSRSPKNNPKGPGTVVTFKIDDFTNVTSRRVLRGGSWYINTHNLRCASRNYYAPTVTNLSNGFRCSQDL